jgi:hypothetical protein
MKENLSGEFLLTLVGLRKLATRIEKDLGLETYIV